MIAPAPPIVRDYSAPPVATLSAYQCRCVVAVPLSMVAEGPVWVQTPDPRCDRCSGTGHDERANVATRSARARRGQGPSVGTRVAFLGALALAALVGCGASALAVQARTADVIARVANTAGPLLVREYDREGTAAIQAAPDRPSATAARDAVVAHWRPLWGTCRGTAAEGPCEAGAWRTLRVAADVYRVALQGVRDGASPLSVAVALVGPLLRAACVVMGYLPASDRPTLAGCP